MGIFGAMTTAVSGLSAQSFALENISGNIANSRTTGFKRVDTSFTNLIPDMPPRREVAGSVAAYSRASATSQGDFVASQVATNLAISGEGMFAVKQRSSVADGNPVFSGANVYTRRGDFDLDRNGYLVNGAGFYLQGYRVDPNTGSATGSSLQVLRISNDNLPARATAELEYRANLPRRPATASYDPGLANSELLTGAAYTGATIAASDEPGFVDRTISGQSVTVYTSAGTPVDLQMRWGKTSNAAGAETWSLYYRSDSAATGAAPKWTRVSNAFTFDASGRLTAPAAGTMAASFTVDGTTAGPLSLDFGLTGLTQFADTNGQVNVNRMGQDGYASGTRVGLQMGDGGRVMGLYSNGQTVALAEVPLAQFPSDNLLKRNDGGVFEETLESGQPLFVDAGRNVIGGTLENSNADIADEFSKMIVTQQAYSANTRIITTAQQMLQDVLNIVR
jgi:flagellar hook protein FlgE